MRRTAGALLLLAALGGCVSTGPDMPGPGPGGPAGFTGCYNGGGTPPMVPGLQGAWGQPVPMAAPYASAPPPGAQAARAMLQRSVPLDLVRAAAASSPENSSGLVQAAYNGACPPGGGLPGTIAPPAGNLLAPPGFSPMPGMGGPGMPSALAAALSPVSPPGAVAAVGAHPPGHSRFPTQRTEIRFSRPNGMKVSWFAATGDGKSGFSSTQIDAPGRYNFPQGAIYRLRLSNIDGRAGLVLYPTLEVVPSNSKTDPFLAHSAVPIEFTNEDFDQVVAGNYVVKVIYLPDPQFQDTAGGGGLEEIVSSRLEAGTDPIVEAQRRGSILAIVRMGNILLELENTPAMDAPNPFACPPPAAAGPGMGFGQPGPPPMVPYPLSLSQNGAPMPNGAMARPGPNGPMMAGPYGPMMAGPNGPMMAGPYGPMMRPNPYGPMMPLPYGPMAGPSVMANPYGPMMPPGPYGPTMGGTSQPAVNPLVGPSVPNTTSVIQPNLDPPASKPPTSAIPTGNSSGTGGAQPPAKEGVPITQLPDVSPIKQVGHKESSSSALPAAPLPIPDAPASK